MTDAAWVALAAGIPATISSLAALVIAFRTGRKVDVVQEQTNGMQATLIKHAEKIARDDERANPTLLPPH